MRCLMCLLLSVVAISLTAPAMAESDLLARTLTPEDQGRLAKFEELRAQSVKAARDGGDASAVAMLDEILRGDGEPVLGVDIRGDYRCRVAKLDGILPLIVYDWFRCEIGEDDIGYRLEKLSGSQRLSGHFVDDSATSLIFYGAAHYADEEPRAYGDPERNIVGRFVKVGEDRYRLEIPLPQVELKFDILELEGAVRVPVRPAAIADAAALADFVNMAGEGLPLYLWKKMAGPGEDAWEVGRRRAMREGGNFSYPKCYSPGGRRQGCRLPHRLPAAGRAGTHRLRQDAADLRFRCRNWRTSRPEPGT